ncbi:MAG: DUF1049 domain-containing protein [Candidatus Aminicenantes bacterium]|nr:DUF1049 domain-containing protein [Candidatus Aminicenantes bacterium]
MWIIRYLIPGIILLAFGIFLGSNLTQKTSIQFLTWRLNEVPLILIVAVAFLAGILVRYYVIFIKWMNKKQIARMKKKILATHEKESEKIKKPEKDYSESMEKWAEEKMDRKISDEEEKTAKNNDDRE